MKLVRTGVCGLCPNTAELQNSHLLPKALYRFVTWKGQSKSSPIAITDNGVWRLKKQITKHFLCAGCEQRFCREGEDWTLRQIYRGASSFKLLQVLGTLRPVSQTGSATIYNIANVGQIDVAKLSYFALSVFWRAAATTWPLDNELMSRLDLGSTYTDALKRYLLGEISFPANMALNVVVCDSPTLAATTLITPSGGKTSGYWSYGFAIPGLVFRLLVGQHVPLALRLGCIGSGTNPLMMRLNHDQFERFAKEAFLIKMRTAKISADLQPGAL